MKVYVGDPAVFCQRCHYSPCVCDTANPVMAKEINRLAAELATEKLVSRLRLLNARRKAAGLPEATRPEPERCECCGNPCPRGGHLSVDHDHTTGLFRGWLCRRCNLGIGALADSVAGVTKALVYLGRHYGR